MGESDLICSQKDGECCKTCEYYKDNIGTICEDSSGQFGCCKKYKPTFAKDYLKLVEEIKVDIYNRLIDKYNKHKDTWKESTILYLRMRIKFLYDLLEDYWGKIHNNIISDNIELELKRVLDLACQSLLLYKRLKGVLG